MEETNRTTLAKEASIISFNDEDAKQRSSETEQSFSSSAEEEDPDEGIIETYHLQLMVVPKKLSESLKGKRSSAFHTIGASSLRQMHNSRLPWLPSKLMAAELLDSE